VEKNVVQPGRPQMTIWRVRIAYWTPKATNTYSGYAILTAFPLQQRLHERASTLRYTYVDCLVDVNPGGLQSKNWGLEG